MPEKYIIDIYTDGACSGNPGKGGYGIVMDIKSIGYRKVFSQGYRLTTNNRMELLAVIVALEKLQEPGHDVRIHTDSRYVSDAINKNWIGGWQKRNFQKVKNTDLWKRFVPLYQKFKPTFHWIRGHNGHPENELCDQMAVNAAKSEKLILDEGYEKEV